tara:strand:+ start:516 stop:977 length:462 start_codon:yes stop_codon:yes gene_type:complete
MGLLKKLYNKRILFAEKNTKNYKLVLSLESDGDDYIISYVNGKINRRDTLSEKELNKYTFIEKTGNSFYKKYKPVDPMTIVTEMDTGSAGIGGTATDLGAPNGDTYATGDARMPKVIGSKKKCKKKKGKKKCKTETPMITRTSITDTFTIPLK